MAVNGKLTLSADFYDILDSGENRSGSLRHLVEIVQSFTSGASAVGTVDEIWSDRRTLANATGEVLDVRGALTKSYGGTLAIATLVAVIVKNRNALATDRLNIGPDATAGLSGMFADASDRISCRGNGGMVVWYAPTGITCGAGTTDELYVDNPGANSIDYDIVLLGRST